MVLPSAIEKILMLCYVLLGNTPYYQILEQFGIIPWNREKAMKGLWCKKPMRGLIESEESLIVDDDDRA